MKNRSLTLVCVFTLFFSAINVMASQDLKISVFKDIAEALGSAGDAISRITDGVKHLVESGDSAYGIVQARVTYNKLKKISRMSSELRMSQNVSVLNSIDAFLQSPSHERWRAVTTTLDETIIKVNSILKDVRLDNSDFILEKAYRDLAGTLQTRSAMITSLRHVQMPTTPEEFAALREVNYNYKMLMIQLDKAIDDLNIYLKNHKPQ